MPRCLLCVWSLSCTLRRGLGLRAPLRRSAPVPRPVRGPLAHRVGPTKRFTMLLRAVRTSSLRYMQGTPSGFQRCPDTAAWPAVEGVVPARIRDAVVGTAYRYAAHVTRRARSRSSPAPTPAVRSVRRRRSSRACYCHPVVQQHRPTAAGSDRGSELVHFGDEPRNRSLSGPDRGVGVSTEEIVDGRHDITIKLLQPICNLSVAENERFEVVESGWCRRRRSSQLETVLGFSSL